MAQHPGRDLPGFDGSSRRRARVAAVCLLLAAVGGRARAESAGTGAGPAEAALAGAALVDTLIVTAAAAAGPAAPAVGGLLTRIELDDAGGSRDLADVLAATAGFQVRRYGAAGASAVPSLRGSSPAQVRLFVDGMPLDDAETGVFNLERLPLERFGAVEIHRGAVPAGLGGIGGAGAVNLLTRRARDGATATAGLGAFGERWASTAWGHDGWLLLAHARRADNDFTYRDHNQTFHRSDDDTVRTRRNAWLREHGFFAKGEGAAGPVDLRGWAGFLRRDGGRPGPIGGYASPHASVRYDRLDGHLAAGWRADLVRLEVSAARTDERLDDPAGEIGFAPPGTERTRGDDLTGRLLWSPGWDLGGRADLAVRAGLERRGQWQRRRWNALRDPERHRTVTAAFAVADAGLADGRLRVAPAWRWQRTLDDFPPTPLPWDPEPAAERIERDAIAPSAGRVLGDRPGDGGAGGPRRAHRARTHLDRALRPPRGRDRQPRAGARDRADGRPGAVPAVARRRDQRPGGRIRGTDRRHDRVRGQQPAHEHRPQHRRHPHPRAGGGGARRAARGPGPAGQPHLAARPRRRRPARLRRQGPAVPARRGGLPAPDPRRPGLATLAGGPLPVGRLPGPGQHRAEHGPGPAPPGPRPGDDLAPGVAGTAARSPCRPPS